MGKDRGRQFPQFDREPARKLEVLLLRPGLPVMENTTRQNRSVDGVRLRRPGPEEPTNPPASDREQRGISPDASDDEGIVGDGSGEFPERELSDDHGVWDEPPRTAP